MIKSFLRIFLLTTLIIFSFYFAHSQKPALIFKGTAKYNKSALVGAKVTLLKNGEKIKSVTTDKNGGFSFELDYSSDYIVKFTKIDFVDMHMEVYTSQMPEKNRWLDTEYEQIVSFFKEGENPTFTRRFNCPFGKVIFDGKKRFIEDLTYREQFENGDYCNQSEEEIPVEIKKKEPVIAEKIIPKIETRPLSKEKVEIAYKTISGNLLSKKGTEEAPYANKVIFLKTQNGKVIQTTVTNYFGNFVFHKLPADSNFIIATDPSDNKLNIDLELLLTNLDNKEISVVKINDNKQFVFEFLAQDKVKIDLLQAEDSNMLMDLAGFLLGNGQDAKKQPLSNVTVYLVDKEGNKIREVKTSQLGKFKFKKLPNDKAYLFQLNETDANLTGITEILMVSEDNIEIKKSELNVNTRQFNFELLPYEMTEIKKLELNDPWIAFIDPELQNEINQEKIIRETIQYAVNDHNIPTEAQKLLNKVSIILNSNKNLKLEIGSHSDSRGSDSYNMTLSEKRAKAAAEYLKTKNIDASRLIPKGYGETKLLNHCSNGVNCSEEEHKINRRVEFKILANY